MAQFSTEKNRLLGNNNALYEVVMIAGQSGPSVFVPKGNLNASTDAFGRLRVSEPHTVFDSSFRYPNSEGRWVNKTTGTASINHNANQGLMDLIVGPASGDQIIRETDRTFAYQPGKSLLVMTTFTMSPANENLRQRVGYFGKFNGVYLEQDGLTKYIVKRSSITGSIENTRISQSDWNVDKLDGTGPSGINLDLSKSQIFWVDIEWLGVGSVRSGFVINGQYIVCHIFHHANDVAGTYITTATLPIRYEITNTGTTGISSTLKQICSTVVSEGGYEQIGITRAASNPIIGKNLTNAIDNPMVSLRLRSGRTDAVVVPRMLTMYGLQNTAFLYKIIKNTALTNPSWALTDSGSAVQYDISATAMTGGTVIYQGVFMGQQTVDPIDLGDQFNHGLQLTRNIIDSDSAGNILTIAIVPTTNNDDAIVALAWQETTQ